MFASCYVGSKYKIAVLSTQLVYYITYEKTQIINSTCDII
jgi:hypothetical protein